MPRRCWSGRSCCLDRSATIISTKRASAAWRINREGNYFVTWILTNDDVAKVLTVDDCLEVLEETFRDYAQDGAVNRPRSHSYARTGDDPVQWYMLKTMDAILPRYRVGGIRLTSDIVVERVIDGKLRREKPGLAPGGRWAALVFFFTAGTGQMVALIHGRSFHGQRVRRARAQPATTL